MAKDKRDIVVLVLIIAVILLLGVLGYIFLLQPALSGLVVQGQNQGVQYTINAILTQVKSNGYVQLPTGENQSIVLVPYQQSQTQTAQ
jgi:hypothetical protein